MIRPKSFAGLLQTLYKPVVTVPNDAKVMGLINSLQKAKAWSHPVIGAAIEVHRLKGPGLIEEIYSKCFGRQCELRKIPFVRELRVELEYKGFIFEEPLRLDFLIDDALILEFKAVEEVLPIHKAQLLSYMKLLRKPLGLLINFHELILKNGIHRLILEENTSP
jgi:GxxExxY protein